MAVGSRSNYGRKTEGRVRNSYAHEKKRPNMIYTVTLNPALDRTVFVEDFSIGQVNRAKEDRDDAGGKGINVSKTLSALGCESLALALLGGSTGSRIEKQLEELHVDCWPFYIPAETRTNTKIVDETLQKNTDINVAGPRVDQATIDNMLKMLLRIVEVGDLVILSGSLPVGASADTYKTWISALTEKGVTSYLDADGEAFEFGIEAKPYLVKPNTRELSQYVCRALSKTDEIVEAAQGLLKKGVQYVIVSRGSHGALFITAEKIWKAKALSVPVGSTVGAGDAIIAGLALAHEGKVSDEEALKLSVATASGSVMQPGTQPPSKELVDSLIDQVEIEELK